MSRNLVKQIYTVVSGEEEKRVIDSNGRIQKRIEELSEIVRRADGDGFVSGLAAETLELPEGSDMDAGGNVIKAGEDARTALEQAESSARSILEEAREEAERIRDNARAQAETEKTRIMSQARQQGYNEGNDQAMAQIDVIKKEYQKKERELENAYQQQIDMLEPQFVDTITAIYEHIFHVELDSYREILTHLISATIRKLEGSYDFLIHVSKEDYPYVSMQKKQMLAGAVSGNTNVDVVEDLTLGKNECMIETESGIYDCGLGTQLSELKRRLLLLAWSKEG